ncbi:MAG: TetR/AcrR family transcriptional regulator [Henriciella sp.]
MIKRVNCKRFILRKTAVTHRIHDAAIEIFATKGATDINVSELAQKAGVARGTIYSHVDHIDGLFDQVVADVSSDMYARTLASVEGIDDPAHLLSNGARMFIRRSHDDPYWGRFMMRFALNAEPLRGILTDAPTQYIRRGVQSGRYNLGAASVESAVALLAGTTLASMLLVIDGHQTWRKAGSDAVELILTAFGIEEEEAREISTRELPKLAPSP